MFNFTCYNGVQIPCIGYGTYRTPNTEEGYTLISNAICSGYRHIDTAQGYNNEKLVGKSIRESGIARSNFFITSKVANINQGYQSTLDSFYKTLEALDTDYLDLLLIHWPIPIGQEECWMELNKETWRAMENLYASKKVRAIGVSNFLVHHLQHLVENSTIKPMVNQIEFHIKYQQRDIVSYCHKNNIVLESWGPLMRGSAVNESILTDLAKKYNKDVAQISIKYCLQKNILPLPKTSKVERMQSNQNVFDFTISSEDIDLMDNCNTTDSYVFHPDRNWEWQETITRMNEEIK